MEIGKVLPEAPVYKPVEYDSTRDEILEDPNKVKEPLVQPVAPEYKPEGYVASRDAFKGDNQTKEPRALPVAPMYKPESHDASRDAPEVKEPLALYSSDASLCRPAPHITSVLPCGRRSPSTSVLNSHQPHNHFPSTSRTDLR